MADAKHGSKMDRHEHTDAIRENLTEIRGDVATLSDSVADYGGAAIRDARGRAEHVSDDLVEEARDAFKKLKKKAAKLERRLKKTAPEHTMAWAIGAFGLGVAMTLILSRGD